MGFLSRIDIIKQRSAYKIFFVLYALFFSTELSTHRSFTIVKVIVILWGMLLIALDFYINKMKILKKINIMLNLFLLINIISLIIFPDKAYNLRIFLITIIQISVLNNSEITQIPRNILKEMNKFNFVFIAASFILSLTSLIMFLFKINLFSMAYNEAFRPDLLKGVFLISNIGGLVSLTSIIITLISFSFKNTLKVFYSLNIIVQLLVLYLTKARGSWGALIIFILAYGFISIKNKILRRGILVIALISIISLPIYGPKYAYKVAEVTDKTEYYQYYGFLSGRQLIWQQGYDSIIKKDIVLGVGYSNVVDTIKSSTTNFLPGIDGGRLHNVYLEILCSHGILALIFMVLFFINNGVSIYRNIFKEDIPEENKRTLKIIFAMFMAFYALSFVESILLYTISVISITYWIYVGYSEYFLKKFKRY